MVWRWWPVLSLSLYIALLHLCATVHASHIEGDAVIVSQPPMFLYEEHLDFRCPRLEDFTQFDSTSQTIFGDPDSPDYVPPPQAPPIQRLVLTRQLKPAMIIPIDDPAAFNSTTDEHTLQLCYHRRRSHRLNPAILDVSLVTFGSADRLDNLVQMAQMWDGLIFIALYVRSEQDVALIDEVLMSDANVRQKCTIHLVFAKPGSLFPFNMLRNIAQVGVETTHMFLVDIDFIPMARTRAKLLRHEDLLRRQLDGSLMRLLIVPAFELDDRRDAQQFQEQFPELTLKALKRRFKKRILRVFDYGCKECHYPTEFEHWLTANEPYDIPTDQAELHSSGPIIPEKFEPYIVVPTQLRLPNGGRSHFLYFDESLAGFGRDKLIHLKMLRQQFGYRFTVLPRVALYHRRHPKTTMAADWARVPASRKTRMTQYLRRIMWWQEFVDPTVLGNPDRWSESREDRQYASLEHMVSTNRWATSDASAMEWLAGQTMPDLTPLLCPELARMDADDDAALALAIGDDDEQPAGGTGRTFWQTVAISLGVAVCVVLALLLCRSVRRRLGERLLTLPWTRNYYHAVSPKDKDKFQL